MTFHSLASLFGRSIPGLAILCLWSVPAHAQTWLDDPEEAIIHYGESEGLTDPVSKLQTRIKKGSVKLRFETNRGYLTALLKELRVCSSSQGLVFSKTSSQADWTSPKTPRALYFNDDVYVGWAPGAPEIDLISIDPCRGPIFYTLSQSLQEQPTFARQTDCRRCHQSAKTRRLPGLVVSSVYTVADGSPCGRVIGFVYGHASPISLRWGGWYVTGTHHAAFTKGSESRGVPGEGEFHLGNIFSTDPARPDEVDNSLGANVISLRDRFETARYPSSDSDIVALLVLEHQLQMHNLLTQANIETRCAMAEEATAASAMRTNEVFLGQEQRVIEQAGERLLEYMLFRNEAPLKGPVRGTTRFAAEFERAGPRASRGRSLRQFDLRTRLFRYPCSYLVYSPAFDSLPQPMKNYLWRRLQEILTGQDQSGIYAGMSSGDRQAVLEILRDTKPEFAAWLRHPVRQSGRETGSASEMLDINLANSP